MRFAIVNEQTKINALTELAKINYDDEKEVIIQEVKKDRSQAQRRLTHMWHGEVAKQTGNSHDTIRNRVMLKLAVPIFYRDNIEVNGVGCSETIEAIRNLKTQGLEAEYIKMMQSFVSLITTNSFTVKQNKEFLDNYNDLAISEGWSLSVPDELRYAFGS